MQVGVVLLALGDVGDDDLDGGGGGGATSPIFGAASGAALASGCGAVLVRPTTSDRLTVIRSGNGRGFGVGRSSSAAASAACNASAASYPARSSRFNPAQPICMP